MRERGLGVARVTALPRGALASAHRPVERGVSCTRYSAKNRRGQSSEADLLAPLHRKPPDTALRARILEARPTINNTNKK